MNIEQLKTRREQLTKDTESFVAQANTQMSQLMQQVDEHKARTNQQLGAFEGARLLLEELIGQSELASLTEPDLT